MNVAAMAVSVRRNAPTEIPSSIASRKRRSYASRRCAIPARRSGERWRHSVTKTLARSGSEVTTSTWASTSAASAQRGRRTWCRLGGRRGRFEGRGRAVDDREEDVLLRCDVGVEARALDVERLGDVADARRRVAVRVEQLAGHFVDFAPPGPASIMVSYLTIVRSLVSPGHAVKRSRPPGHYGSGADRSPVDLSQRIGFVVSTLMVTLSTGSESPSAGLSGRALSRRRHRVAASPCGAVGASGRSCSSTVAQFGMAGSSRICAVQRPDRARFSEYSHGPSAASSRHCDVVRFCLTPSSL